MDVEYLHVYILIDTRTRYVLACVCVELRVPCQTTRTCTHTMAIANIVLWGGASSKGISFNEICLHVCSFRYGVIRFISSYVYVVERTSPPEIAFKLTVAGWTILNWLFVGGGDNKISRPYIVIQ